MTAASGRPHGLRGWFPPFVFYTRLKSRETIRPRPRDQLPTTNTLRTSRSNTRQCKGGRAPVGRGDTICQLNKTTQSQKPLSQTAASGSHEAHAISPKSLKL
jgi:hypothetical protein